MSGEFEVWSVQELFESELEGIEEMLEKTDDETIKLMLEQTKLYIEARLNGSLQIKSTGAGL